MVTLTIDPRLAPWVKRGIDARLAELRQPSALVCPRCGYRESMGEIGLRQACPRCQGILED